MLKLFVPTPGSTTGAEVDTNGATNASPEILLLNILIELRVTNAMFVDAQRGILTQTPEQYRSDEVNAVTNPSK